MDKLTMRILDALVDDEEQLEEVFLIVNFQRQDNRFDLYREHYRLADIVLRLQGLEKQGLVISEQHNEYPPSCGVAAGVYSLTDEGRNAWQECVRGVSSLYGTIEGEAGAPDC